MASQTTESVAGTVRAEMARRQLSQLDLAGRLGISPAAVRRRLNGSVAFDTDELEAVAQLFDMDARELLPATH